MDSGSAERGLSDSTPLLGEERDLNRAGTSTTEDQGNGNRSLNITPWRGVSIGVFVFVLVFFQASNISLLTTTQGLIATEFDAFDDISWFTSAYLIAMSSITPLGGRICRIFSPRTYITFSSLVFAIGVLVTSLSHNLAIFLLGRTITGVGSAGMLSVVIILILELASVERRGLFIGLANSGMTVGVSLGAVIAGALAPAAGWRSVFWIQCPIIIAAGLGVFLSLPQSIDSSDHTRKKTPLKSQLKRIDYGGACLLIATMVLFLYGLSSSKILPVPIILSLVLLGLFILIESRFATEPFIPVAVLKSRGTLFSCFATLGMMMARWSVLFYTPVYAIAVRSWSPASGGLILLPTNAGFGIGGLLAGWIHIRRAGSFYISCVATFVLFAATLFALGFLSTDSSPVTAYIIVTFLNGLFTGAALNYNLAHLLHLMPEDLHTIATPLLAVFRGFAGSFGSSIGGGIFTRSLRSALGEEFADRGLGTGPGGDGEDYSNLIRQLAGNPSLVHTLSGLEHEGAIAGYEDALRILFVSSSALGLAFTLVQASTGWKGPGAKKGVETDDEGLENTNED
ncbi:putative MFS multidrug transporter [Lineolata rhizophorae]|uniref:Putative MFS multidrug transporter n=1 Tax=Lineolata rhizophorae TaxID=578093 RepID=A0A6A6NV87_9PEZI|nr:putative MFS multidrug transporter [Lineolata rhizophorae]